MSELDESPGDVPLRLDVAARRERMYELLPQIDSARAALRAHVNRCKVEGVPPDPKFAARVEELYQQYYDLKPDEGLVYVIGFGPYVKIGWTTTTTQARIASLQTSAPEPLRIYGEIHGKQLIERQLHAHFKEYRLQGEWFRKRGRLSAWIRGGCKLKTLFTPKQVRERGIGDVLVTAPYSDLKWGNPMWVKNPEWPKT